MNFFDVIPPTTTKKSEENVGEDEWEDCEEAGEYEEFLGEGFDDFGDFGVVEEESSHVSPDESELRRQRLREQRRLRRQRHVSPENVDGAIPKEALRKLSNKTIRELILHAKMEIERYETENFLFERTIQKLETPEKILEEHAAPSKEMFSTKGIQICPSEDEEESEDESKPFVPVVPIKEIDVSQDSFFDSMSDNSKEEALKIFREVGEIAPLNFDVIRHTYGDLVKGAKPDPAYTDTTPSKDSNLNDAVLLAKKKLYESHTMGNTVKPPVIAPKKFGLGASFDDSNEDEQDFAGFSVADAKLLSLEDKLKFALEEEEDFRHQFYKHETLALREEGAIQVHIDAHKHCVKLLLSLRRDFRTIMKDARHANTGKFMAEMVLRFKRKMRNVISSEETKTRINIRKIMSIKKRALHQLKTNKESGNSISQIDFEHLMVENQIFLDEMDEMNLSLKYLKQLSGHFFQVLKADQNSIEKLNEEDQKLAREIETKRNVIKSFEKTYQKYRKMIKRANTRMDDLKRKLSEFQAPKAMEYIRLKACQYELEADVANLQRKLDEINLSLLTARSTFAMYCKMLPQGDQTEFENHKWLNKVKSEVKQNDLMNLMKDEDNVDEFLKKIKNLETYDVHPQEVERQEKKNKTKHVKGLHAILMSSGKVRIKRRSLKPSDVDNDFAFELSSKHKEPPKKL